MAAFDVHDHRHALKLLRDTGETSLYAARGEVSCPACGEQFERLFTTQREATSVQANDGSPFCLVRDEAAIHVFRH